MPELRDLADKRGASVLLFNPRTLKIKPGLNIRDMNSARGSSCCRTFRG